MKNETMEGEEGEMKLGKCREDEWQMRRKERQMQGKKDAGKMN